MQVLHTKYTICTVSNQKNVIGDVLKKCNVWRQYS